MCKILIMYYVVVPKQKYARTAGSRMPQVQILSAQAFVICEHPHVVYIEGKKNYMTNQVLIIQCLSYLREIDFWQQ